LIGAGSGGFDPDRATRIMLDELRSIDAPLEVTVVRFRK
jgi:O-acetyl-ADP-ribose deacetylase (regulator of RNase III)